MSIVRTILVLGALATVQSVVQAQTTVAGVTPGSFRVTESGAAEYRIPLRVPPGIAGMEPKLALVYNSQAGNGLLGVGWNLEGLSSIARCPRTMAQDGVRGGVNHDVNDRFCLDGQRLMLTSGPIYGAGESEYRPERESFSKIAASAATIAYPSPLSGVMPQSFVVKTKDGMTMEYGNTADSRIEAQGETTVRVWALNKVSDTKGNYFTVTYTEDYANGDFYPTRIRYTGNSASGLSPLNSVCLIYDNDPASPSTCDMPPATTRPDVRWGYVRGSVVKTLRRLTHVRAYAGELPVAEYRLAYHVASATQRSRLGSITQCSGDGASCLATVNLTWQESPTAFMANYSDQTGTDWSSWPSARPMAGDFNGDGKTDIAISANTLGGIATYLSDGNGGFTAGYSGQTGTDWVSNWTAKPIAADFNGDGLTDIAVCVQGGGGIATYLSNGNGTFMPVWSSQTGTDWCSWADIRLIAGDFNGDGLTDLAVTHDQLHGIATYFANGNGTFSAGVYSGQTGTDWVSNPTAQPRAGDFNGDGFNDIAVCVQSGGGIATYLSSGNGTFTPVWSSQTGTDWCSWSDVRLLSGDFNGDGLTDLAVTHNQLHGIATYFAKGNGTFSPGVYSGQTGTDWASNPTARPVTGDFNADGLTDIGVGADQSGGVAAYLSNGDGTFRAEYYAQPGTDWTSWPSARPLTGDVRGIAKSAIMIGANTLGGIATYLPSTLAGDVLISVSNGADQVWSAVYRPGTDPTVYTKDTGAAFVFPVMDVQVPIQVVFSASQSNGIGGSLAMSYKYGGLKAEVGTGRGLLGFRWTEATQSSTGVKVRSEYSQDWPYVGMPSLVKTTQSSAVLSQVTNTLACKDPDTGDTSCPVAVGKRYFSFVPTSEQIGNDLNGAALPTVTTTTSYDSFGNVESVIVSTGDGYSKTTTNVYNNDTTNWLLGRLKNSAVQNAIPAP